MEQNKKMKVAMICHFSDTQIRSKLPLSKMRFTNFMMKLAGQRPFVYGDYAKWITSIAAQCYRFPTMEMHIIAPMFGLKTNEFSVEKDMVNYHIIKNRPSYLMQGFNRRLLSNRYVNYSSNYKRIQKVVRAINPDIVVLVGAENPCYSGSVLNLDGFPIYLMCQTVFDNEEFKQFYRKEEFELRRSIESKILKKTPYVGVNSKKYYDLLRVNGFEGNIFFFDWPSSITIPQFAMKEKQFDFINFANSMSRQKGYHDSVKALAIVKKKYPKVRLALVNNGPMSTQKELETLITDLHLEDNIKFVPFFPDQQDLFNFLDVVRFGVLPCKLDNLSGTMLQCLSRGIPIVVYKTTGTPSLNDKHQCALIAEMNDVDGLANHMLSLLDDNALAERLRLNAIKYMHEYLLGKQSCMDNIVENFKAIINNYKEGVAIPKQMLCNF